ncbi:hypothetical protein LE181_01685 [Streptomyces sp. SCA3-4]|uniref:hypothetical protein n=1 Tax=Streptomyces sichuanensis TaxID=2871810 RepID=UPI001CE37ED3|nr:hypothetical protein [Streptomyces sichuanensis]MCA6090894.1 hypothetical protein [Streptomyces sichuanensis]
MAITAPGIAGASVQQHTHDKQQTQHRHTKTTAYKDRTGPALHIDSVKADVVAHWSSKRDHLVVELRPYFDRNAKVLPIDGPAGESTETTPEKGWFPRAPEISVPVKDPLAEVTVRTAVGGKGWQEGMTPSFRAVRLSPTGIAYNAETGQRLPSNP